MMNAADVAAFVAGKPASYHRRVAVHEAGHAFVAVTRGLRFREVEIDGDAELAGAVREVVCPPFWNARTSEQDRRMIAQVDFCLAGPVAEWLHYRNTWNTADDSEAAAGFAQRLSTHLMPSEVRTLLRECRRRLRDELSAPYANSAMQALVAALVQRRRMSYTECRDIVANSNGRSVQ